MTKRILVLGGTGLFGKPTAYQLKAIGFFGGKLDYGTLKLLPRLFVEFIIRGVEGDFCNWDAIREWVKVIRPRLEKAQ